MDKQKNWGQLLSEVQAQKAPHFLFTRIQARLEEQKAIYFSPVFSKVLVACIISLFTVNAILITKLPESNNESQTIAKSMGILSSENIYEQP